MSGQLEGLTQFLSSSISWRGMIKLTTSALGLAIAWRYLPAITLFASMPDPAKQLAITLIGLGCGGLVGLCTVGAIDVHINNRRDKSAKLSLEKKHEGEKRKHMEKFQVYLSHASEDALGDIYRLKNSHAVLIHSTQLGKTLEPYFLCNQGFIEKIADRGVHEAIYSLPEYLKPVLQKFVSQELDNLTRYTPVDFHVLLSFFAEYDTDKTTADAPISIEELETLRSTTKLIDAHLVRHDDGSSSGYWISLSAHLVDIINERFNVEVQQEIWVPINWFATPR